MERNLAPPGRTVVGLGPHAASGRGGALLVRLASASLALALYVALFAPLYRVLGPITPVASAAVVVLAAWLLGSWWGLAFGGVFMPINAALFAWKGDAGLPVAGHLAAGLVFVGIGWVIGRLRELTILVRRNHSALAGALAGAHEAQRALAEREAQLAQAHALARTGYFVLDLESWKSTWSTELCRILGEDPAIVKPSVEGWFGHIHPDDREYVRRRGDVGMQGGLPVEDEFRIVRSDGKLRWVYGRVQTLRDEVGKPVKLLGTVQDLTEQKELQSQLAAAERLAAVGTLAGGVAHEINNPLSSVISNLEFVLEEVRRSLPASSGVRPTELVTALGEALEGADRVTRIVHDLMAFSRPRGGGGPVDLERVLDLSVNMAAIETRYRARVVKDYGAVPRTDADAARLGQVFLSLLVNAAQAIPPGHPEHQEIRLTTRSDGKWIEVSVSDTGTGMSSEVQRHAFEPFFTTRPVGAGVGLGLSTSLAFVRSLGGDITVKSEQGKGSVVTVTLPVLAGPPDAPAR